ncbi:hypothetical protein [Oceaniferula spumae]|uniref:hypothetical protein n=1 Tax=Oceaniferula spumae TaxID=2979115 RepID=UPI003F4E5E92
MKIPLVTLLVLMTLNLPILADRPAGERPRIFVSEYWKTVTFSMMPGRYAYTPNRVMVSPPYGVAHRLQPDGSMKEIYRVSGWYSHQVFLSMDGRYLVRMGPWSPGRELSKDHVAVQFYKDGKLLKSYSTIDLVKDPKKIELTVNHYFWRGPKCKLETDNKFILDTIDGLRYVFDATSGEVISKEKTKSG